MKTILKALSTLMSLAWVNLIKKLRNSLQQFGTHLQIAVAGVTFCMLIINTQQVKQVNDNSAKIETAQKEIQSFRSTIKDREQATEARIDSMQREVLRLKEINLKLDRTVAQAVKDIEQLKVNKAEALKAIDGFTPEQLVEYFNSKSLKKK